MSPRGLILSVWTLLLLAGCGKSISSSSGESSSTRDTRLEQGNASDSDAVITLERSGCLGTCPTYKLIVFGDGLVLYEGRENVKTKGIARTVINQDLVRQLISEFSKADFFTLKDRYETVRDGCFTSLTDQPWVFTSIRINGTTKSVAHDHGCVGKEGPDGARTLFPSELTALEDKIDETVNSKLWLEGS